MRLKSRWIGLFLGVAMIFPSAGNRAFAQDTTARVEQLSKDATKKYRENDYEGAIELFKQAHDLEPVPNLLFNVAKCYEKLEQWDLAIEYYQKFVVEPDVDKTARQSALDRINALQEVQQAEKLAAEAKKDDGPVAATPKESAPTESIEVDHTWAYITLGSGVALLAGGGIFGVLASSKETDFEQGTTFDDRQSAKDSGETYALVADGLFVTGGILAVVGVILYVTADSDQQPMASTPVKPFGWVGQGGAGLGLTSSF